jgi:hypothetical protein
MKILFDNGTPRPISRVLVGHVVTHARQVGWHELENGELIQRAETTGYDLLHLDRFALAVNACAPFSYEEIDIPFV